MQRPIHEQQWSLLSELIAGKIGLYFSPERREDLRRNFTGISKELGFEDQVACMDWLLNTELSKTHLQVLASHLTIGETYFFRDRQALDALADNVLPELIRSRRGHNQRLRLWSAGCCSGEEAYSLAILLHRLLPDLSQWHITITATDINTHFLRKARSGIYSEWSFRDAPAWLKARYFNRTADGRYAVIPEIKKLVTFKHLNLVEGGYPSTDTDTHAMDVILCRNVLMYFAPSQANHAIRNFRLALVEGGWLIVSPTEVSASIYSQFVHESFPDAILFQKREGLPKQPLIKAVEPIQMQDDVYEADVPPAFPASVDASHEKPAYIGLPEKSPVNTDATKSSALSSLARNLADQGKLIEALACCDSWIASNRLDAEAHYLRAIILLEQGAVVEANISLRRAIYLAPDFVLAHFTLASLAQRLGKPNQAARHFSTARRLLNHYKPNEILPEADGLTASRLAEMINAQTLHGNLT